MTLLKMTLLKNDALINFLLRYRCSIWWCTTKVLLFYPALRFSGTVILSGAVLLRYCCSIRYSPVIHFPCREGRKEKTGCLEDIRSLT